MAEASSIAHTPVATESNRARFRFPHFPVSAKAKLVWRWAAFLYVVLALCPIRYETPTDKTFDNSWFFALNYATARHLVMGRDIVWTWGPFYYLFIPFNIRSNLAQGLLFQGALWVLLIVILWDLFFRGGFPLRNLAVSSVLIGLSTLDHNQMYYPGNLLLYPALILIVHFRLRGGNIRYVTALAIIGLMPLIQIFGTLIVVGVVAGLIVDLFLRGINRLLTIVLAVTVPAAVAIVSCRLALGSFQTIASYFRWNVELSRGYSYAMSTAGPRIVLLAASEGILLLAAVIILLRDRAKAKFFTLILVIPVLLSLKHGFVRQDAPHVASFFCFLGLACALVVLAIPLDKGFASVAMALVLLSFAILWRNYAASSDLRTAVASITAIGAPLRIWDVLRFKHLGYSLSVEGRATYSAEARTEPEIKSIVGHEPVGFLSDVYSNALMDDLNLVLFPVIQRYSAYTPRLDQLDAMWIDEKGPEFLIFDGASIDARHQWTESPATWTEVYRWYNKRLLGKRSLLLQRRASPRFTRFEPLVHRTIYFGEDLRMPLSSDLVFWTMRCSLSSSGELRALLARVPAVMMDVTEKDGRTRTFRVVLPVLISPSLGTSLPSNLAEFAQVFSEREERNFSVAKLQFRSLGQSAYRNGCDVELSRALP
jgi:hypothetical protein